MPRHASAEPSVYFFIPNLIGYLRILLCIVAFAVAKDHFIIFYVCYAVSQVLDQWDGWAARRYGQSSRFGAVLDMVTDRCSTACLQCILIGTTFYPNALNAVMFLIALDISSHYARLYATLAAGEKSHKDVSDDTFLPLRIYYGNRVVLYILCFGNESFFLLSYLRKFWIGPQLFTLALASGSVAVSLVDLALAITVPVMLTKHFMNFVQLLQSAKDIKAIDDKERADKKKAAKASPAKKSPKRQ